LFLIVATRRLTQPRIKNNPPIGVRGPKKFALFMFNMLFADIRYREPEKSRIPNVKNHEAALIARLLNRENEDKNNKAKV